MTEILKSGELPINTASTEDHLMALILRDRLAGLGRGVITASKLALLAVSGFTAVSGLIELHTVITGNIQPFLGFYPNGLSLIDYRVYERFQAVMTQSVEYPELQHLMLFNAGAKTAISAAAFGASLFGLRHH